MSKKANDTGNWNWDGTIDAFKDSHWLVLNDIDPNMGAFFLHSCMHWCKFNSCCVCEEDARYYMCYISGEHDELD